MSFSADQLADVSTEQRAARAVDRAAVRSMPPPSNWLDERATTPASTRIDFRPSSRTHTRRELFNGLDKRLIVARRREQRRRRRRGAVLNGAPGGTRASRGLRAAMNWTTRFDVVAPYASPYGMIDRAGEYAINTPPPLLLLLLRPTRQRDNVMRVTGDDSREE